MLTYKSDYFRLMKIGCFFLETWEMGNEKWELRNESWELGNESWEYIICHP